MHNVNKGIQEFRPGLIVEVSLAFWRDSARQAYEKHAPSVEDRIKGIKFLREAGIPVVLRIDPLFPRSPITENPIYTMADFELPEAQTIDDLNNLAEGNIETLRALAKCKTSSGRAFSKKRL